MTPSFLTLLLRRFIASLPSTCSVVLRVSTGVIRMRQSEPAALA
eukprot:CAMPEP_0119083156 /NCGR_PEP_ID=MMETSP1178-20130426/124588_1 /TAXON_ID=33656 /ORGANISM="unid sp, Strain CCMP2000" /LENGTH=43 /DNA_ID= /DNA_START= /DNA_END= /DNA_ORIENTATION=